MQSEFQPRSFLHDLQTALSLTFDDDIIVDQSNLDIFLFKRMLQIIENTISVHCTIVHAPLRCDHTN